MWGWRGDERWQSIWVIFFLVLWESRNRSSSACNTVDRKMTKVHALNDGEVGSIMRGINLNKGQFLYGQLTVSTSQSSGSVLVTISWPRYTWEVPIWVYLRRQNLPTSTHWDKTARGYLLQQKSVLRLDDVKPGLYYIAVEAREAVGDLTMTVDILPKLEANEVVLVEDGSQMNIIFSK